MEGDIEQGLARLRDQRDSGGGALEFHTAGGCAAKDMHPALPAAAEADATFAALGFEKERRYWYRADIDGLFAAPALACRVKTRH